MLRSPDDASLAKVRPVEVPVSGIFRLSKFPRTEPYFARQAQYRFDDPEGAVGAATFGVLYVAQDPETAFCESIIHANSLYSKGTYQVASAEFKARHLVCYKRQPNPNMFLADLTGDGLKALGLNNDISASDSYTIPQQWAAAIHSAHPTLDGIRYVSRQRNNAYCYALFDRCSVERASYAELPDDLADLLCRKFNVVRV